MNIKETILTILVFYAANIGKLWKKYTVHYWGAIPNYPLRKILSNIKPHRGKIFPDIPNQRAERLYNVNFQKINPLVDKLGAVEKGYDDFNSQKKYWEKQVQEYSKFVPFGNGVETALDIGCGYGSFAAALKGKGCQTLNMDLDIYYPCQQVVAARGLLGINWSARAPLPFADNGFDSVHSHDSMYSFNPAEICSILLECDRILRPGGFSIIYICQYINSPPGEYKEKIAAITESAKRLEWKPLKYSEFIQEKTGQNGIFAVYQKPLLNGYQPPSVKK
jgi:SAM-dependent methyltransferase